MCFEKFHEKENHIDTGHDRHILKKLRKNKQIEVKKMKTYCLMLEGCTIE